MYVNEQKLLYLMLDNSIYKIDMNTFTVSTMIDSKTDDCYAVSKSGRYLAWVEPEHVYDSTSLRLEDLKTGIAHEIRADEGNYIVPIAFIGEDFVYGVANAAEVKVNAFGDVIFPMNKLEIMNTSEEKKDVIKTYLPNTGKIGEVSVDDNNIYVELVVENNGRLVTCGADTIMNRHAEPANAVKLRKSVTDLKQTQVAINMKEIKKDSAILKIFPKHILLEEPRIVNLEVETDGVYYVYARGKVLLATRDAGAAVRCANENLGVVVDGDLDYIFKRARSTSQASITNLMVNEADANASSFIRAMSAILVREGVGIGVSDLGATGQTPLQIMQGALKEYTVLELKSCSVDEVLYFINQGTPVIARTGVDRAILLTGYTSNSVSYYDPVSKQNRTVGYEELEGLLTAGDNYFIAYVK